MTATFKDHVFTKPWMTEEEQTVAKCFIAEALKSLARQGVEQTPFLLLRLDDVLTNYILTRRLERRLIEETASSVAKTDDATPPQPASKKDTEAVSIEAVAKSRERLRKSLKELEESYDTPTGKPKQGLADYMKPIIEQAGGVLEDALQFEARKRKTVIG